LMPGAVGWSGADQRWDAMRLLCTLLYLLPLASGECEHVKWMGVDFAGLDTCAVRQHKYIVSQLFSPSEKCQIPSEQATWMVRRRDQVQRVLGRGAHVVQCGG
jgi:hypothetical protein